MTAPPARFKRRSALAWAGAGSLGTAAALVGFWPTGTERAAYPLAGRLAGRREPLWNLSPEVLERSSAEDAARLERLLVELDRAVAALETLEPRLANAETFELTLAERERLRGHWWQVFERILAVDELKQRYRAWYGLDYRRNLRLHARAFALSFAALLGQVNAGLRVLEALRGKKLLPVLFDEAMPSFGLPARTLSGLRSRLGRARDLFYVPAGDEWYEHWMKTALDADAPFRALAGRLERLRGETRKRVLTPTSRGVDNKLRILQGEAFASWFPVQKRLAEWAGDTRFTSQTRRLIDDRMLAEFRAKLEPGDIIVERRNWYLSNVGLPGFWPHAALYAGTQAQILAALAEDPDVKAAYGELGAHFERVAPKAWQSLSARDGEGHELCVIEAVSEGVISASVEHSCAADYVAALRPRLPKLARARAIERALRFWGRPYDFNFDFATDDQIVCSELVIKAYEPAPGAPGLELPYVELVGRRALPPTEFVRAFRDERGLPEPKFEFVAFLEGREGEKKAVVADAEALAATCTRPKWDIAQP